MTKAQVAIYARYSSDKQSDASIEDQVRRCRLHLTQQGIDPTHALVFTDYAVSGASLDRPGFQGMMAAVEAGEVSSIVTESLSRISRDTADTATTLKQLRFRGVPLQGIVDAVDTSKESSQLLAGFHALINEQYLVKLAKETRRGLVGKFQRGLATGNVAFGYRTHKRADETGSDVVIEPTEAALVRRIFQLYADGASYATIASKFNSEGIPNPRAKTKHKERGWVATTIRAMLHNERYRGRWSYGSTKWVKRPGTNKRVPQKVAPSEVMTAEIPELAIVPAELWAQVQARLDSNKTGRPQGGGGPRAHYPLSGLLKCADCGGSMTILGGSNSARRYRCNDAMKRGTCDNRLSVKESDVRRAILAELRKRLTRPAGLEYIRAQVAKRLGQAHRTLDADVSRVQVALDKTTAQISNMVGFIAKGIASDAIASELQDAEARQRRLRAELETLKTRAQQPIELPSLDRLTESVLDLETIVRDDPKMAKGALRRLFRGGSLKCEPTEAGYRIHGDLLPMLLVPESDNADPKMGPAISVVSSGDKI